LDASWRSLAPHVLSCNYRIESRAASIELAHVGERLYEGIDMKTKRTTPKDIDDYIAGFPEDVQKILKKVRTTIRQMAPDAEETISYQIPTFKLNDTYLIYFAGFKNHISLYPAPRGAEEFKKGLSAYEGGKGTVQFPLDKPIPVDLIKRIVKFKVKENQEKAKTRRKKK
jgi:uncharacterized protein YdhG (YjbR/CyaY superfamily)